jgi:hypothetical protein
MAGSRVELLDSRSQQRMHEPGHRHRQDAPRSKDQDDFGACPPPATTSSTPIRALPRAVTMHPTEDGYGPAENASERLPWWRRRFGRSAYMDSVERYSEQRARMHRLIAAESPRELCNTLTEAEMQESYNAFMEAATRPINREVQMRYLARAQTYAEELMRRETVRLRERMQRLIVALAVLVILATIMSVMLSTLILSFGG